MNIFLHFSSILNIKHIGKIAWVWVSKYAKKVFASSENCVSCFVYTTSGMVPTAIMYYLQLGLVNDSELAVNNCHMATLHFRGLGDTN